MAKVTIDGINRGTRTTKYGEKPTIGILVVESKVVDINDNDIDVNGRWMNGFGNPITDKWEKGMTVSVQITEQAGKTDPSRKFINFKANPTQSTEAVVQTEVEDEEVDHDDF